MENKKAMDMIDRLRGMFPEKMEAIDSLEAELMADEEMPEAPADDMAMEADGESEDAAMEMDDMDMGMEDEEAPMPKKKKKPEDEEDEEYDMFA